MKYSETPYEIHKLTYDPAYELVVEVFKDDGRIIAAYFRQKEVCE